MPQLRRITLKLCQVALRIKNSVFIICLLEDEHELSLGMLIRLQHIYNFWLLHAILSTVLGNIGLYYPDLLFFAYFSVSKKRKTKRSPIDLKLHGTHFWKEISPEDLECTSGDLRGGHEAGGAPHPHDRLFCSLEQGPSLLDHVRWENHVPKDFIPFGLRLIFLFFENLKQAKTTILGWASG